MDALRKQIIRENYEIVMERIEAAKAKRNAGGEVTLLAATKTVPAEEILFAIEELGLPAVGENKVQEFLGKDDLINPNAHRHFIGHLQIKGKSLMEQYAIYKLYLEGLQLYPNDMDKLYGERMFNHRKYFLVGLLIKILKMVTTRTSYCRGNVCS